MSDTSLTKHPVINFPIGMIKHSEKIHFQLQSNSQAVMAAISRRTLLYEKYNACLHQNVETSSSSCNHVHVDDINSYQKIHLDCNHIQGLGTGTGGIKLDGSINRKRRGGTVVGHSDRAVPQSSRYRGSYDD